MSPAPPRSRRPGVALLVDVVGHARASRSWIVVILLIGVALALFLGAAVQVGLPVLIYPAL